MYALPHLKPLFLLYFRRQQALEANCKIKHRNKFEGAAKKLTTVLQYLRKPLIDLLSAAAFSEKGTRVFLVIIEYEINGRSVGTSARCGKVKLF